MTIQALDAMQQQHKNFHEHSLSPQAATGTSWKTAQQYMGFQAQLIRNLKLRSQANQERLQSEITLVILPFVGGRKKQQKGMVLTVYRPTT